VLEHPLSDQDHKQIVQTIEMFEVITQTQPDDYQSLEILKEAYRKVGRNADSLRTSRRLAEAYFNAGSYTLAMQECDAIVSEEPNAPDILSMLGEIEARLQASGAEMAKTIGQNGATQTHGALIDIRGAHVGKLTNLHQRGTDHLAKFLIVQQLFLEDEVKAALELVEKTNKELLPQTIAASLLNHLCQDNMEKLEKVLSALIDRTKFAYVPLEYYDVDRQVAPMLPDTLTLGRLFVPFDLVSRTMMVACCNPFDATGREAVQQSVDYTVMWYLARPSAIVKTLQGIYRLEPKSS
jgi:tetratricopeptide (TPR) repeat protein